MQCNYSPPPYARKYQSCASSGFTLVELSIVLLVIGLLVSGILVGQDMIRAAELRSVVTEKDKLQTAVLLFKQKYDALPGDMPNATAFWGTMTGGSGCNNISAGATTATGTQTCNGNGNGNGEINGFGTVNSNEEIMLFTQHLSNAGLIEGKYTGIFTSWGNEGEFYKSRLCNKCWWVPFYTTLVPISNTQDFEGSYDNYLVLNNVSSSAFAVAPSEAWAIDKKIDDGLPGLGKMVTRERNGVDCNNVSASNVVAVAQTATYNLLYNQIACELEFKNMW